MPPESRKWWNNWTPEQMCNMKLKANLRNLRYILSCGALVVALPGMTLVWAADRATILQALGVLDPDGKPTPRLEVVKAASVAKLTQEDWQKQRDKMLQTCNQCHSSNFAKQQLEQGDHMIRDADRLMADAIRIVAGLYSIWPKTPPFGSGARRRGRA